MPDKEIFVLKIVWKKSIASLHCLTQAVQRANLRRTAGDPTWVFMYFSNYSSNSRNVRFYFAKKHTLIEIIRKDKTDLL